MDKPKSLRSKVKNFLKNKNPLKEILDEIKEIISYCSDLYYDGESESPLLDAEYDKLVNHYSKFAEEPKAVDTTSSKRNKNLIDTQHLFPELVGTLDKTNYITEEEKLSDKNPDANTVESWLKKNYYKKKDDLAFFMSWKIDGNSITLSYNDKGKVIMALTRGKNGLGSDKTQYFKDRKLPECIKVGKGDIVGIKYEAVVSFDDKAKIEEIIGKEYASPCSLTAGLLGSNDAPKEAIDLIKLVPIRIQYKNQKISRLEEISLIKEIYETDKDSNIAINPIIKEGIVTRKFDGKIHYSTFDNIINEIRKTYEYYIDNREKLPYPVDGLVFEFVDDDVRKHFGRDTDRNNFEFALKFPYDKKRTVVEDIEFYVSNNGTGRITPVVRFKPIRFSRAVCDHVSIANYDRFKKLALAKGDEVIISYRNDVLSYLNIDEDMEHVGPPIKFISKCPVCNEKLKVNKNRTFVHCVNKNCPSIKVGRFNNFLIKIGVDSVRENILSDLYNAGLLTGLASLYKLKVDDIVKIDGYKKQSAQNIINSINAKKEVYDYELLGALGFKNISTSTCKDICRKFTIKELELMTKDDFDSMVLHLIDINGIAEKTATQFEKDFTRSLKTIRNLEKHLTILEYKNTIKVSKDPKNIVFTGFRNSELQKKLEAAGHSVKGSVSSKTHILVTKEKGSGSVKEKKAKELGCEIYSIDEFMSEILQTLTE